MKKWLVKGIIGFTFVISLPSFAHAAESVTVQLSNYLGDKSSLSVVPSGKYVISQSTEVLNPSLSYTVKAANGLVRIYEGSTLVSESTSLQLVPSTSASYLTLEGRKYLGVMTFKNETGTVRPYNQVDLETYLKGVVPSEMSESWGSNGGIEALKAQAVTARTYTVVGGYTSKSYITDTQSHQVYGGYFPSYTNSITAVDSTRGQILTYNKNPISALYSSSNGGYIESNRGAWGSPLVPYLSAKPDQFDPVNRFSYNITEADLIKKLNTKTTGYVIHSISSATREGFTDGKRTIAMRFMVTAEDGTSRTLDVEASAFRTLLGTSNLKSIYFNEPTKSLNTFTFTGQGFGHGVGMSQYGALAMSQQGYDYKNILAFYYSGTELYNNGTYSPTTFVDKTPKLSLQTTLAVKPAPDLKEKPKPKPLIREAKKQKPLKPIRISAEVFEKTAKIATVVTYVPKNPPNM